jgi:hypothetical protein
VRYEYKKHPQTKPHPAFPNDIGWIPILHVRLSHPDTASKESARFEAVVDSGCADTLFHASIGQSIGLRIRAGTRAELRGIVKGARTSAYFHQVDLHVDTGVIRITAGFCEKLPVAGILGRRGFFEHFIVKFDPTLNPPGFELERVVRC